MDLLFKEYASPFVLLDEIISSGMFCEFLDVFDSKVQERQRWEFFIHKLPPWDDTSWEDFNKTLNGMEEKTNIPVATDEQLETIVKNSHKLLSNFDVEGGE